MTIFWDHPEYTEFKDRWKLWRDLYKPTRAILSRDDILWRTNLERKVPPSAEEVSRIAVIRADREIRSRYLNIPRGVVSIWQSIFLKSPLAFNEEASDFLEKWNLKTDVDGKEHTFDTFVRDEILRTYLVFGKVTVLAEAYGIQARSLGEQKALGLKPYLACIEPLALKDWEFEEVDPKRIGKYNMLRHEFDSVIVRNGDASVRPLYRRLCNIHRVVDGQYVIERFATEIDQNGMYTSIDKDTKQAVWTQINEPIFTGLQEIPAATLSDESWIEDVCEETLRHYNLRSIKDSTEFNQGFQRVFVKGVNTSDPKAVSALSDFIIGALPTDGGVDVVEPIGTADLRASVTEAAESALKIGLDQQRRLSSDSLAAQAAESQAQEQEATFALVKSVAAELSNFCSKALYNLAQFTNLKDFKGSVTFSGDVKPEDMPTWLTVWQTFKADLEQVPDIKKAVLKRIITKLNLPDIDDLEAKLEKASIAPQVNNQLRTAVIQRALSGERTQ